jgi:hypothetical protein
VLVAVDAIDTATEEAVWYAERITGAAGPRALLVPGRHTDPGIRPRFFDLTGGALRLEVLQTTEGRVHALLEEVWRLPRGESDFVTLVVPEQFRRASLLSAAGRNSFRLKLRLLSEPGVVVTDVPAVSDGRRGGCTATRLAVRVLVANVHAGALRALNYAQTLGVEDTRVVSFAVDAAEAAKLREDYLRSGPRFPLDLSEAPFRDLGRPLLAYLRELTADPETVVNVVMPEVVVRGWERFLHNQRAFYVKRLLLFEPRVILSSVPYQLFR